MGRRPTGLKAVERYHDLVGAVPDRVLSADEISQLVEFVDQAGRFGGQDNSLAASTRSWIRFNAEELPAALWQDERLGAVWRRAWQAAFC